MQRNIVYSVSYRHERIFHDWFLSVNDLSFHRVIEVGHLLQLDTEAIVFLRL